MDNQPGHFSLAVLLGFARARGISMGGVLDAVAAERFIARVEQVEKATALLALTGYHLLPIASRRAELFPAITLRFNFASGNAAVASAVLGSICDVDLNDQCRFHLVRLAARSAPPDFAPSLLVAEVGASLAGTAVHLPVDFRICTAGPVPSESQPYPSALPGVKPCRVPCESLAAYTAELMSKILSRSGLDVDAGCHFQLAYLVRHHWSKISVAADLTFDSLREVLQARGGAPLSQLLDEHREVWAAGAASAQSAQRWSEFLGLRALGRMLESNDETTEGAPVDIGAEEPAPAEVDWTTVAAEVSRFLYRVG